MTSTTAEAVQTAGARDEPLTTEPGAAAAPTAKTMPNKALTTPTPLKTRRERKQLRADPVDLITKQLHKQDARLLPMKLPLARTGELLQVRKQELEFSFHPMVRSNRRWGVHSTLYAADPWAVIEGSANEAISTLNERVAATSFVRQAREYFSAAERASSIETRPLLFYYSFLNLAKAIAMLHGRGGLVGKVTHGIALASGSGHTPSNAQLQIYTSSPARTSAIDELHRALEKAAISSGHYAVSDIIPQSVIAHRMWREAFGQPRNERFIPVEKIQFMHDASARQIWLTIWISKSTLLARRRSLTKMLQESKLDAEFAAVSDMSVSSEHYVLEQSDPTPYTGRAADVVATTVDRTKHHLWQTITATPPYRRFYLYLSPGNERRMPQWLSTYSIIFWLGSLTRYQPVELFDLLDGKFGPFFREFLETQPKQLLYILASEAKKQNVTRAAIV